MTLFIKKIYQLFLTVGLMQAVISSAQAQVRPTRQMLPADSTKVYNYVARMPVYPGGGGVKALAADLLREFRAVSGVTGCAVPEFPIYVTLTVGPSGTLYDVKSINNQPLPVNTGEPIGADGRGQGRTNRSLQQLPAACEQALVSACRKLPRLQPGTQNNRRVAVNLIMRLN